MILFLLNQSLRRCFMDLRSHLASCFFTLFAKNCRKYTAFSVIETLFAKIISSFILKNLLCASPSHPPFHPHVHSYSRKFPQLGKNFFPVEKIVSSRWKKIYTRVETQKYPGMPAKTPGYLQPPSLVMIRLGH